MRALRVMMTPTRAPRQVSGPALGQGVVLGGVPTFLTSSRNAANLTDNKWRRVCWWMTCTVGSAALWFMNLNEALFGCVLLWVKALSLWNTLAQFWRNNLCSSITTVICKFLFGLAVLVIILKNKAICLSVKMRFKSYGGKQFTLYYTVNWTNWSCKIIK